MAVDNEKQSFSLVQVNYRFLRADTDRLKKIEQFVVNHKLQQHPDRAEPPNSKDVQM
jgi:hypothetical protein